MKQIILDKSDPRKLVLVMKSLQTPENVEQKKYFAGMPSKELEIIIFNINISEIVSLSWKPLKDSINLIFTKTNSKPEVFVISKELLLEIREYLRGSKVKIDYQINMFN